MPGVSYIPGNSPLHRLNPVSNLIILICLIVLILFFNNPLFSFLLLIIILSLYLSAGLQSAMIIKKGRFLVYFSIIIFFFQLIFYSKGTVLFRVIPQSSPIFPGALSITTAGVMLGISMMLRFLGIVLASLLFVAITDPNKLAYSLMRLGLPYRFGFMFVTALRFLPLFEIEANTVRKAQLSRGIKLKNRGIKGIYTHIKYTMRPLIVSALQKAETVARAMEGRGFGVYSQRSYIDKIQITKKDMVIISGTIFLTIILLFSFTIYYDQNYIAEFVISKFKQRIPSVY